MEKYGMTGRKAGGGSVCCRFHNGGMMTGRQEVLKHGTKNNPLTEG